MTAPQTGPDRRILIARFATTTGAKDTLGTLKNGGIRLGNAAHITQNAAGEIDFSETQDWGLGKSAAIGALAAAFIPGIGIFMGAAAGAAAAYFIDLGFPDPMLKQMGSAMLAPGQSCLVALVQAEDTAPAERIVTGAGGQILASGTEQDLATVLEKVRTA
ncbi:MAG: DUF1269 domain-containing protein [Gemmatimonadaceae bacterium]|jgi:uncharacterized membrane protein|nr:DUF1269 domain-containing protein [Gemmatimonadaceae bacterium]